jgi:REP-associated tyrosine transposase
MKINKNRRSIRLPGYDYTQAGAYFITVCTHERQCVLGEIVNGEMYLNEIGKIVEQTWLEISKIRKLVALDVFVVMPNHFHGIIVMHDEALWTDRTGLPNLRGARDQEQPRGIQIGSVGAIIGQFKSRVTKRAKALGIFPDSPLWQRNYYDHIIRDEEDLSRIREYIYSNPQSWYEDDNNPTIFEKSP